MIELRCMIMNKKKMKNKKYRKVKIFISDIKQLSKEYCEKKLKFNNNIFY